MFGIGNGNQNIQRIRKDMKGILAIGILAIILALSTNKPMIEDEVAEQIEESQKMHDSAMIELKRLHDINDSLLDKYFGK